jgi:hypothetical protein
VNNPVWPRPFNGVSPERVFAKTGQFRLAAAPLQS